MEAAAAHEFDEETFARKRLETLGWSMALGEGSGGAMLVIQLGQVRKYARSAVEALALVEGRRPKPRRAA